MTHDAQKRRGGLGRGPSNPRKQAPLRRASQPRAPLARDARPRLGSLECFKKEPNGPREGLNSGPFERQFCAPLGNERAETQQSCARSRPEAGRYSPRIGTQRAPQIRCASGRTIAKHSRIMRTEMSRSRSLSINPGQFPTRLWALDLITPGCLSCSLPVPVPPIPVNGISTRAATFCAHVPVTHMSARR